LAVVIIAKFSLEVSTPAAKTPDEVHTAAEISIVEISISQSAGTIDQLPILIQRLLGFPAGGETFIYRNTGPEGDLCQTVDLKLKGGACPVTVILYISRGLRV